jgi:hypothetical protein
MEGYIVDWLNLGVRWLTHSNKGASWERKGPNPSFGPLVDPPFQRDPVSA